MSPNVSMQWANSASSLGKEEEMRREEEGRRARGEKSKRRGEQEGEREE